MIKMLPFIIPLIFIKGCRDCSLGTFNDREHGICRPWTEYVSFLFCLQSKVSGLTFLTDAFKFFN